MAVHGFVLHTSPAVMHDIEPPALGGCTFAEAGAWGVSVPSATPWWGCSLATGSCYALHPRFCTTSSLRDSVVGGVAGRGFVLHTAPAVMHDIVAPRLRGCILAGAGAWGISASSATPWVYSCRGEVWRVLAGDQAG